MANNSRIKINPVTKEIEIEGTEQFVETYFGKIQEMISGAAEKKTAFEKRLKTVHAVTVKAEKKKPEAAKGRPKKKGKKVSKKKPGAKRITNLASVIGLIQGSTEGISTAELKEKTGLTESQIWNIVNYAAKEGKIRKIKRGLYGAFAAKQ